MRRLFQVSVLAMGLVGLMAAPALADPPGNNGTVKIDGIELDSHSDNEPHPGCLFEVDFYGFGPSLDATSTFYAWPPTGTMQQIEQITTTLDGDDSEGGGSEAGYDGGTGLIDLSDNLAGIIPHPQQGFHVKVQVDVPEGSDSNAFSKYKVFWVTCEYSPSPEAAALAGGQVPVEFTGGSMSPLLIVALITLVVGFIGARVGFGRITRRS
jgi:hypothetical protein